MLIASGMVIKKGKRMKKKEYTKVYILIILFAILVGTGTFYMSLAFDFPILNGNGNNEILSPAPKPKEKVRKPNARQKNDYSLSLRFKEVDITDMGAKDAVQIIDNGKVIAFNIRFDFMGETKKLNFTVTNNGVKPAIYSFDASYLDPDTGISVIWPDVTNLVLKPGEVSPELSIIFAWASSGTGEADIRANLNYKEYIK